MLDHCSAPAVVATEVSSSTDMQPPTQKATESMNAVTWFQGNSSDPRSWALRQHGASLETYAVEMGNACFCRFEQSQVGVPNMDGVARVVGYLHQRASPRVR